MLISYNWLKSFISLKEPVETVLNRLIHAGVAVENIKPYGAHITKVVVAELLEVAKHPQADRLSLTKVSTGKETFKVVCGAKNIAPGQKVPLAVVGAVLPGNFEIKAAKIRGEESFGMLCSAKELGLAEEAEGILILPPDAPVGEDFCAYMGLPDTLFDLEITPNRADLLSHLGVAREIGAILNRKVQEPKAGKVQEGKLPTAKLARVTVKAPDLCQLYTCRVIEGVKIGPSPRWLVQTLERLGQRSINNVVDITNYVLQEMGQPLHAFDLNQVKGAHIIVRKAEKGEKIPLLDNTERELDADNLVIADAERPIALAGIMGGGNSQVTDKTINILLESALFLPGSVRRTSRRLGISTDSSYRFERGVDPNGVVAALNRAASLIVELAGGSLAKGVLSHPAKTFKAQEIKFRPSRANTILGTQIPTKDQLAILKNLGCTVKGTSSSKTLSVKVPSARLDLTREIDLIEEVARLSGYDRIPVVSPNIPSGLSPIDSKIPFEQEVRFLFHQKGLFEAINSTFLPPNYADKLKLPQDHPLKNAMVLLNPIAEDQKVLRPTLLPSLLVNVQLNLAHQQEQVGLYELNKIFLPAGKGQPTEKFRATAVLANLSVGQAWYQAERKTDYYDIKGLAEDLLAHCRFEGVVWEFGKLAMPYLASESFSVKDKTGALLLWGGSLHPKVLKEYELSVPCQALELDLTQWGLTTAPRALYSPLPRFPEAWRDIALVVPDGVTSSQVLASIEGLSIADLKGMTLFDQYRGNNVKTGCRSLAYRLRFQNVERTLTDGEVTEKVSKIVAYLKEKFSIELR